MKDIKCSLGARVSIKDNSYVEPDQDGSFIELDHGDHHAAAIIVWRMDGDEVSPEREAFARRLVASFNECAHESLENLERGEQQNLKVRLDDALEDVRSLYSTEKVWECTMMETIGEDGPASVAEAIDALKLQRDTAWRELAAIRRAINANPEESTLDEVVRILSTKGTQS